MTHPEATPQRRKVDQKRFPELREWWGRWGGLIKGVWGVALSIVLVWVALGLRASQHETDVAAKQGCLRSRDLGPAVLADYGRRRVLTPKQLERYRALIPKTCPK